MLFGDLPIDATRLAGILCENVRSTANAWNADSGDLRLWTKAVDTVLETVGAKQGFKVRSSLPECGGEWLFDIVWQRDDGSLALIAESEWADKGVLYDFHKLLVGKAPLKVLIYDGGDKEEHGKPLRDQIALTMKAYSTHVAGEVYLLVGFGRFGQRAHLFTVPHNGSLSAVEFEPVPQGKGIGA